MNQGLLLERNGELKGIRKAFHSSREVIVRDSARLRADLSPAQSDLSVADISRTSSSVRHKSFHTDDHKPLWRGSIKKKCWVCNNIVCSCDRSSSVVVDPSPTIPRTAVSRQPSKRTTSSKPVSSLQTDRSSNTSKYDRLHRGLAASDHSSAVPSSIGTPFQTPRSGSVRDQTTHHAAYHGNHTTRHEKLSVRKVTRHRLRTDEHGVLHSSEFDDDEIISTASAPIEPHYSRPLDRNANNRASTSLAELAAGAEPVRIEISSPSVPQPRVAAAPPPVAVATVLTDVSSFHMSPLRKVVDDSVLSWTPAVVPTVRVGKSKRSSKKKSSKRRSRSSSSSSTSSSDTTSRSSTESTTSDDDRGKQKRSRHHSSGKKAKRASRASDDQLASRLAQQERLLLERIEALTSHQQRLQENVAAAESQIVAMMAKKSAEEALRHERKRHQRESSASPKHPSSSASPLAAAIPPTKTAAPLHIDPASIPDEDIPVHPAFRPKPARAAAPAAPKLYKGGIPMGGGVGHLPPPAPPQDPIAKGGYGGYLMRGLVTVVTFPVACCFGRRDEDDDDEAGQEVVAASTIDPTLLEQAMEVARQRPTGLDTSVVPPPADAPSLQAPQPVEAANSCPLPTSEDIAAPVVEHLASPSVPQDKTPANTEKPAVDAAVSPAEVQEES